MDSDGRLFPEQALFPAERTVYFSKGALLDLGGETIIETYTLPGHTPGSTLFLLKDENFVFTGDAVGSGGGLWLFDYDSFDLFYGSFRSFMEYIRNPANNISEKQLTLWEVIPGKKDPGNVWEWNTWKIWKCFWNK